MDREKLVPEEKVNLTIAMVDTCVRICADGIRDQNENIQDENLTEKLRARILSNKRRHHEVQKLDKFEGLIRRIVRVLNDAGIDYMFTGALAASYYGLPRTTMDVDVVVKVTEESIQTLAAQLRKAGIQANEQNIQKAFKSSYRIITLKDENTAFSVGILLSNKELEKKPGTILGLPTFYQTSKH